MLLNAFFLSHFTYFPLICMFYRRRINNEINRLHERCLRIIYIDNKSSYIELLEKGIFVSIHKRNLSFLAIEMPSSFKVDLPLYYENK